MCEDTLWQAGDHDTPVRLGLLRDMAASLMPPLPDSHPLARRAAPGLQAGRLLKERDQDSFLVADPVPNRVALEPWGPPGTCCGSHKGLCKTRDARLFIGHASPSAPSLTPSCTTSRRGRQQVAFGGFTST